MSLKIGSYEKNLIQELNTLSGYSLGQIKEVLEFLFIRQMEDLFSKKEITIPYIGTLKIEYGGDVFVSGGKIAEIQSTFEPSSLLRKAVGEAEDGNIEIIESLIISKITDAMRDILES